MLIRLLSSILSVFSKFLLSNLFIVNLLIIPDFFSILNSKFALVENEFSIFTIQRTSSILQTFTHSDNVHCDGSSESNTTNRFAVHRAIPVKWWSTSPLVVTSHFSILFILRSFRRRSHTQEKMVINFNYFLFVINCSIVRTFFYCVSCNHVIK